MIKFYMRKSVNTLFVTDGTAAIGLPFLDEVVKSARKNPVAACVAAVMTMRAHGYSVDMYRPELGGTFKELQESGEITEVNPNELANVEL